MRFSANLTFLWPELDVYDRCRAAADAGFGAVEILFPHELDASRLERALTRAGLRLVLFDVPPGRPSERGMLCLPEREADCLSAVRQAIDLARRFGTPCLNLLAGMLPADMSRQNALHLAAGRLRRAGDEAAMAGVRLLIENISPAVADGYLARTAADAAWLVRAAAHPAVGLQLDQFHVCMVGDDPLAAVEQYGDLIGHVQIADTPDRHQPGTGRAPVGLFLEKLQAAGYQGYVGLEYHPLGTTAESLAWLPLDRRR